MRLAALVVALAACQGATTDDPDLATYLSRVARLDDAARVREVAAWKLTRAEYEQLVVTPYQSLWGPYAHHFDELAPSLVARLARPGAFIARKHVANDRVLTPSQGRLRWTLPLQYPSLVAAQGGEPIDTVFVRLGGHWRSLSGIDEELLARARALDPTCGERLASAGRPSQCTEVAWMIADAALRGQPDRFAHACKLASTTCPLREQ